MVSELNFPLSALGPACPFNILDFQSLRTHSRHLAARDSCKMVPVHPIVEHSLRERSVYGGKKKFSILDREWYNLNTLLECPYISGCFFPIWKSLSKVDSTLIWISRVFFWGMQLRLFNSYVIRNLSHMVSWMARWRRQFSDLRIRQFNSLHIHIHIVRVVKAFIRVL